MHAARCFMIGILVVSFFNATIHRKLLFNIDDRRNFVEWDVKTPHRMNLKANCSNFDPD